MLTLLLLLLLLSLWLLLLFEEWHDRRTWVIDES